MTKCQASLLYVSEFKQLVNFVLKLDLTVLSEESGKPKTVLPRMVLKKIINVAKLTYVAGKLKLFTPHLFTLR